MYAGEKGIRPLAALQDPWLRAVASVQFAL
jgi:hypothetical protein